MAYLYQHVKIVRVLDGDTVEMSIDMGNSIEWTGKFRLYGIDTPERHGETRPAGDAAAECLNALIAAYGVKCAETLKPDKYGRWLVKLTLGDGRDVAECLSSQGHAKAYFGGKKE